MKQSIDKLSAPIIQGGMGVGISMGSLAGAVAAEGGMGVISTANIGFREPDFWNKTTAACVRALHNEIAKAKEIAGGKGLIAVNVMVATTQFALMVREAARAGADAIISGAGLPLALPEVAGDDILIAPIVSSGRAARLIRKHWEKNYGRQADLVVVEGGRAGGHLGFKREELLDRSFQPMNEAVRDVIGQMEGQPVFGAGGVFTAEDVRALQRDGAAGAQIATRFIATDECDASQGYKDVIMAAREEDAAIIQSPVGMPGRAIRTPLIERVEAGDRMPPDQCIGCIHGCNPATTKYCINKALTAAFHGDYENGLFFCGDNVGRVNEQTSVHELMKELTK